MSALDNLKKNRKSLSSLRDAAEKLSGSNKGSGDDRFWKPTRDENDNGMAVIRFLPSSNSDDLPWVSYFDHFFKGPTGKWYVEKSLTSIGDEDPVSKQNSILWNTGLDSDKDTARKRKRRMKYVANIVVIDDKGNPANNGKVFMYEFGKTIFDKLMNAMNPEFEDEEPINPFDPWEGANFRIKIRKKDGYVNYDSSVFDGKTELFDGDEEKLEAVLEKVHNIQEFIDPKTFKSYGELDKKLRIVLGPDYIETESADHGPREEPSKKEPVKDAKPEASKKSAFDESDPLNTGADDDDIANFFNSLAD